MPYYGPNEDSGTIFFERTFLAGMFVVGVGYGMQLILYIVCARYLWQERHRRGRVMDFLLAYITFLLGLSSLWASSVTWMVEDIYINNRNYPGGPWLYFLVTQNLPEEIILIVGLSVLTFLSDILMIWRCWVVWNSSSRAMAFVVVAFPFLTLLTSIAMGIVWILESDLPGPSLFNKMALTFGTAYYATSLGVNIAVTILIIIRLESHRRLMLENHHSEHATLYMSIMTMIVESAALYSVVALAFIILYAFNHPVNEIFMGFLPASQQIASYLIILRFAQGRAWSANTATGSTSQVSTMQFNDPPANVQVDSDLR